MNIDNLKPGMKIPNYKALCEVIEEESKSSDSKKSQLSILDQYVRYHKKGHTFIIDEIYAEPKTRIDLRSDGNRTIYGELIQSLVLDLLSQKDNNGSIYLSTNRLMRALEMINDNYAWGKLHMIKLSDIIDIGIEDIYDFYSNTYGSLQSALELSLDQLRRKSLIHWSKMISIYSLKLDENNMYEGIRMASDDEIKIILKAERYTLLRMGYNDKKSMFLHGKWQEFKDSVNKILQGEHGIAYYWNSYNIVCNQNNYILQELNSLKRKIIQSTLNSTIKERLYLNATNRHKKIKNRMNGWGEYPEELLSIKDRIRINNNYLSNFTKLSNLLIEPNAKNIQSFK